MDGCSNYINKVGKSAFTYQYLFTEIFINLFIYFYCVCVCVCVCVCGGGLLLLAVLAILIWRRKTMMLVTKSPCYQVLPYIIAKYKTGMLCWVGTIWNKNNNNKCWCVIIICCVTSCKQTSTCHVKVVVVH